MPKKAQPDVVALLARVQDATARLREREQETREARGELADAIRDAADGGVSYAMMARVVGVTRQRVSEIARRD